MDFLFLPSNRSSSCPLVDLISSTWTKKFSLPSAQFQFHSWISSTSDCFTSYAASRAHPWALQVIGQRCDSGPLDEQTSSTLGGFDGKYSLTNLFRRGRGLLHLIRRVRSSPHTTRRRVLQVIGHTRRTHKNNLRDCEDQCPPERVFTLLITTRHHKQIHVLQHNYTCTEEPAPKRDLDTQDLYVLQTLPFPDPFREISKKTPHSSYSKFFLYSPINNGSLTNRSHACGLLPEVLLILLNQQRIGDKSLARLRPVIFLVGLDAIGANVLVPTPLLRVAHVLTPKSRRCRDVAQILAPRGRRRHNWRFENRGRTGVDAKPVGNIAGVAGLGGSEGGAQSRVLGPGIFPLEAGAAGVGRSLVRVSEGGSDVGLGFLLEKRDGFGAAGEKQSGERGERAEHVCGGGCAAGGECPIVMATLDFVGGTEFGFGLVVGMRWISHVVRENDPQDTVEMIRCFTVFARMRASLLALDGWILPVCRIVKPPQFAKDREHLLLPSENIVAKSKFRHIKTHTNSWRFN